ncbi:helix-turn-helix transcriptional regulator [Micromonospora chalcea]|uniref:helix-turn-helix transcriptional regulator n=1 Tax=Micromonospora chalcea TaxID=1874 RepID=UPI0021A73259|nr:helix-turn-helix transcriptional regulator [Micromonospora chalcea]MCT2279571.1 helix-turn-helix transcriptional regulator [Micromonospora chalcea]
MRLVGVGELALGTALLIPDVPAKVAGAALTAFSAGLLGLYLRIPGMRAEGSSHPEQPITIGKLADLTGVSERSLQAGFQRYVGISPTAYLRQLRLDRAHEELRQADPDQTTVAAVAHRWGFAHLGRFASSYRVRHGESPSETLKLPAASAGDRPIQPSPCRSRTCWARTRRSARSPPRTNPWPRSWRSSRPRSCW